MTPEGFLALVAALSGFTVSFFLVTWTLRGLRR